MASAQYKPTPIESSETIEKVGAQGGVSTIFTSIDKGLVPPPTVVTGTKILFDDGSWVDKSTLSLANIADGDKGDITVSGSGSTWTIDNGAVTFSKIQSLNSSILLGRGSASSGSVQEITPGTGLIVSGTTITTDPLVDGGSF